MRAHDRNTKQQANEDTSGPHAHTCTGMPAHLDTGTPTHACVSMDGKHGMLRKGYCSGAVSCHFSSALLSTYLANIARE